MLYAIKKPSESNERLINRFKKIVQRSRIIMDTKQGRYHTRKLNKDKKRAAAIARSGYRTKRAREQFYS